MEPVRKFSAYHFVEQRISITEKPDIIVPAGDKLLLVRKNKPIEIICATEDGICYTFPVLGTVSQMFYCTAGDYVATLETRKGLTGLMVSVHVYVNWYNAAKHAYDNSITDGPHLRLRIAGQVTPSGVAHEFNYLDVIELPMQHKKYSCLACCPETGMLLACSENMIYIFEKVKHRYNGVSSLEFIDFEPFHLAIQISFPPTKISTESKIITAMNNDIIAIFKLHKGRTYQENGDSPQRGKTVMKNIQHIHNNDAIDEEYKRRIKQDIIKENGVINLNNLMKSASDGYSENHLKNVVGSKSFPVTVLLPGVNDSIIPGAEPVTPFISDTIIKFLLVPYNNINNKEQVVKSQYLTSLMELEFMVEKLKKSDKFTNVLIRPLYKLETDSKNQLSSVKTKGYYTFGVVCLITTIQTGYLYFISFCPLSNKEVRCKAVYNFAAPIINVQLEPYLLHVLTSNGLETYNLITNRLTVFDYKGEVFPPNSYPVSILGSHSFIGAINFVVTNNHLVVFSSPQQGDTRVHNGSGTIYFLTLPRSRKIYEELASVANEYKINPEAYRYLLTEAFTILHMGVNFKLPISMGTDEKVEIADTYMNTCIELLELCLRNSMRQWKYAARFFHISGLSFLEFINLMKRKLKTIPQQLEIIDGILYMLRKWAYYNPGEVSLPVANGIIEIAEIKGDLSFIGRISLMDHYVRDSARNKISALITETANKESLDVFSAYTLCIILAQRNKIVEASLFLSQICNKDEINEDLIFIMQQYWPIIFDKLVDRTFTAFSDVSHFFMDQIPMSFSRLLANLLSEGRFTLNELLALIVTDLSVYRTEGGNVVMKCFLEIVLSYDRIPSQSVEANVTNAAKILLRSYLSDLKNVNAEEQPNKEYCNSFYYKPTFTKHWPEFVELLPPVRPSALLTVRKLQDLLCAGILDYEGFETLHYYLLDMMSYDDVRMNLIVFGKDETVEPLLVDNCPNAIFLYGQYMYKEDKDWIKVLKLLRDKAKKEECQDDLYYALICKILNHMVVDVPKETFKEVISLSFEETEELYVKFNALLQRVCAVRDIKLLNAGTGELLLHRAL